MRAPQWFYLSILGAVLFTGCPNPEETDSDGDGTPDKQDCAPFDANVHPGQTEQCDGVDVNCDGLADDGFSDNDGDGVAFCNGAAGGNFQDDCDDNNADVRPGLIEACDGIDNNCNNQTDEVTDIDGDGFTNCGAQPDCDDGNATVNPGATEVCDNRDNNCNNQVDEGFDVDQDNLTTCQGDCNDNNAAVRPGAAEVCDNADNNCNNDIDEGFDIDGDGFTSCGGDCDDLLANRNPNEAEICDLFDNNCNNQIDEGFDADGDGATSCGGDCDDADPSISLGFAELDDNKDNNCNGLIDEIFNDNDGDGFSPAQGDCDDTIFQVGPGAIEFQGNNVDDDCDGTIDEPLVPCDGGALNNGNALDFAKAIGLCNGEVVNAQFVGFGGVNGANARAIVSQFGTNTAQLNRPAEGTKMAILSSGRADTSNHDNGTAFDNTTFGACTSATHPDPKGDPGACGDADPATVCDLAQLQLTIRVPTNAQSFSYNFQFFTSEYPSFRCSAFDDTFLAELNSQAFNGNISFDNQLHVVSVNNGFFDICLNDDGNTDLNDDGSTSAFESSIRPAAVPPNVCTITSGAALAGTGYVFDNTPNQQTGNPFSEGAGATTLLTTFSPVVPGETITLKFIIFDEGDDALDSTVVFDNFLWGLNAIPGPVTQQ